MAVDKIECPECGKVLRPAKPVAPGKKVRCPECATVFEATGGAPTAGASQAVKPALAKKTAAPAAVKPIDDDEEDGGGTYGVVHEPEDLPADPKKGKKGAKGTAKPTIDYVPDLTIKDPRGPAVAALAKPSNLLMIAGAKLCVGSIAALMFFTWPFMFTKWGSGVYPSDVKKEYERKHPKPNAKPKANQAEEEESSFPDQDVIKEEIDKNTEMTQMWNQMTEEDIEWRWMMAAVCIVVLVYGAFLASSAVKMQNLESYRWAMASAILGIVGGFATPVGIWAFTILKKPKIKEAFEYHPE